MQIKKDSILIKLKKVKENLDFDRLHWTKMIGDELESD